MLNRKEWIRISTIGAAVVGLAVTGEYLTGAQFTRMADLRKRVSNSVSPNAAADIQSKKRQLKTKKANSGKWQKVLAVAEKVFPKSATSVITNIDVAALVSSTSANLVKCDKGPSTELSWNPPPPAEGSSDDSSDADPKANLVKYGEDVLSVTLRGDFGSWLKFLVGLEQLRKFYRFKDLTMTSTLGAKPDQPPLTINLQLASYRVSEFPSDRKPADGQE